MLSAKKISDLQYCQTNRLLLLRPTNEHLKAVVAVHGDPETNRFNPSGQPQPKVANHFYPIGFPTGLIMALVIGQFLRFSSHI